MAWIQPIYDRTRSDITNRTTKGYFNTTDWERIYNNSLEVKAILEALRGIDVTWTELDAPSIFNFPQAVGINVLIQNIENIRIEGNLTLGNGLVALKTDWLPGIGSPAPNYETVNDWERNLALLRDRLLSLPDYQVFCGVAAAGQLRMWQNRFRRVQSGL